MVSKDHASMDKDHAPGERRRRQNRIAQRRYRDKMAEQAKRIEEFAHQARQLLNEAVDLEIGKPRCPQCSHCKEIQSNRETAELQSSQKFLTDRQVDLANNLVDPPRWPMGLYNSGPFEEEDEDDNQGLTFDKPLNFPSCSFTPTRDAVHETHRAALPATHDSAAMAAFSEDFATLVALPTPSSDRPSLDCRYTKEIDYPSHAPSMAVPGIPDGGARLALPSQDAAAIQLAAREGHTTILSILLRKGFNADSRDAQGRTPLHQCAMHGHIESAKALLAAGADTMAVDLEGTSVILAAVKAKHEQMVELLLDHNR